MNRRVFFLVCSFEVVCGNEEVLHIPIWSYMYKYEATIFWYSFHLPTWAPRSSFSTFTSGVVWCSYNMFSSAYTPFFRRNLLHYGTTTSLEYVLPRTVVNASFSDETLIVVDRFPIVLLLVFGKRRGYENSQGWDCPQGYGCGPATTSFTQQLSGGWCSGCWYLYFIYIFIRIFIYYI